MKERERERGDIVSDDRLGFHRKNKRTRTRELTSNDLDSSEEDRVDRRDSEGGRVSLKISCRLN